MREEEPEAEGQAARILRGRIIVFWQTKWTRCVCRKEGQDDAPRKPRRLKIADASLPLREISPNGTIDDLKAAMRECGLSPDSPE